MEILLVCFDRCACEDIHVNYLGILYKSGWQFCEANNFNVVNNDCFTFDGNPFSSAPYSTIFSLVNLCLVIVGNFLAR